MSHMMPRGCTKRVAIIAAFALAGCLIGCVLWLLITANPYKGDWRQLDVPADPSLGLIDVWRDYGSSILVMAQGKFYSCQLDTATGSRFPCQQVTHQDPYYPAPQCEPVEKTGTPIPPGKVIAQHSDYPCIIEGWRESHTVLLEDGTLWAWTASGSSPEVEKAMIFSPMFAPAFGLTGAVAAILAIACINRNKRTNS